MRERLPRRRIGVIADIRFDQDVADSVIGEALGDIDADLRRRQPAQRIIGEAFAERGVGIAPGGQPAEHVIAVAEILHRAAGAALNGGEIAGQRREADQNVTILWTNTSYL